jgi:hypothetical protein
MSMHKLVYVSHTVRTLEVLPLPGSTRRASCGHESAFASCPFPSHPRPYSIPFQLASLRAVKMWISVQPWSALLLKRPPLRNMSLQSHPNDRDALTSRLGHFPTTNWVL